MAVIGKAAPEACAAPSPFFLPSPSGLTRGSIHRPFERSPWMPGSSPGMTMKEQGTSSHGLLLHADRAQRMVGMGIGVMMMSMVVAVAMCVAVVVIMPMVMIMIVVMI